MTSWHPLVVYLYGEGLARFATEPYSIDQIERRFADPAAHRTARRTPRKPRLRPSRGAQRRRCMHLTNSSLNKHSQPASPHVDAEEDASGSKWCARGAQALRRWRATSAKRARRRRGTDRRPRREDGDQRGTGDERGDARVRTALRWGRANTQCFQLFGFDVMLDANCRPWLLEVNLDPALGTESPLDLEGEVVVAHRPPQPRRSPYPIARRFRLRRGGPGPPPPASSAASARVRRLRRRGGRRRGGRRRARPRAGRRGGGGGGVAPPAAPDLTRARGGGRGRVNAGRARAGSWRRLFPHQARPRPAPTPAPPSGRPACV